MFTDKLNEFLPFGLQMKLRAIRKYKAAPVMSANRIAVER